MSIKIEDIVTHKTTSDVYHEITITFPYERDWLSTNPFEQKELRELNIKSIHLRNIRCNPVKRFKLKLPDSVENLQITIGKDGYSYRFDNDIDPIYIEGMGVKKIRINETRMTDIYTDINRNNDTILGIGVGSNTEAILIKMKSLSQLHTLELTGMIKLRPYMGTLDISKLKNLNRLCIGYEVYNYLLNSHRDIIEQIQYLNLYESNVNHDNIDLILDVNKKVCKMSSLKEFNITINKADRLRRMFIWPLNKKSRLITHGKLFTVNSLRCGNIDIKYLNILLSSIDELLTLEYHGVYEDSESFIENVDLKPVRDLILGHSGNITLYPHKLSHLNSISFYTVSFQDLINGILEAPGDRSIIKSIHYDGFDTTDILKLMLESSIRNNKKIFNLLRDKIRLKYMFTTSD